MSPIPFKDPYEITAFPQEHPLGDVVESPPLGSAGLYVDHVNALDTEEQRVEFEHDDLHHDTFDHLTFDDHHDGEACTFATASNETIDPLNHSYDHSYDQNSTHDEPSSLSDDDEDEWAIRRRLLERDRLERQLSRERLRRERRERRAQRASLGAPRRRRRPARGPRGVDRHRQRADQHHTRVPGHVDRRRDPVRNRRPPAVPSNDQPGISDHLSHVAVPSKPLRRSLATRAQGAAMVLYFALLPYVVYSKWRQIDEDRDSLLVHAILVLLIVFWLTSLCQVVLNVRRLQNGRRVNSGASAWLAGLVVAIIALVVPAPHSLREPTAVSVTFRAPGTPSSPIRHAPPRPLLGIGSVPLALMAKRRRDDLRDAGDETEFDVEESIELLRGRDPEVIAYLAGLAADRRDGVLDVADQLPVTTSPAPTTPIVACVLGPSATGTLVGFSREGGRLPVRTSWSPEDLERNVISLHEGRVAFAHSEPELLRALATRSLRHRVVVYLGPANDVDDELAECTITVRPYREALDASDRFSVATPKTAPQSSDLRVELLRADPRVVGLVEPFTPTLRRRCVEMVSYLALHRHEPVTGERLRTRVLTHADADASPRTLANTASAVRRSLGVDARGPRLHPVSSSGLYVTHGLSSDVELFSTLVARARALPVADASSLAHQALLLVKGEPLASALRGFEWFLAEGHGARLARDGEWAALALHHASLERGNYELAFWSLQQGLLIDPFSDALGEALGRVPRLRKFGGDRARASQHRPVSPRGAVAMSWSFARFTQQISQ